MTVTRQHRAAAALGGLLAAGAGLGLGELTAALVSGTSPVVGVGAQLIDRAPGPAKDWAVRTLGTADKPVLIGTVLLAVAVFALVAGAIGATRPRVAVGLTVLLGAAAILAAATGRTLAENAVTRLLPGFVTLAVATVSIALVLRALPRKPAPDRGSGDSVAHGNRGPDAKANADCTGGFEAEAPAGFDRRGFLLTTMALGIVGAGGFAGSRLLAVGSGDSLRAAIRIPRPASVAPALPAGVSVDVAGISSFMTPNKSFYRVDTLLTVPRIDPRDWELRIHGLVDRELRLSFADLLGRRPVERDITLTCVSNEVGGPYIGNARWIGVPIAGLLREVGVRAGADAVKSTSVDGLTIGTPLAALTDGRDAILAVAMNGEPLPFEHGFPVRMVVPCLYGYVSATKWIVDFEVTRFAEFTAYWTERDWRSRLRSRSPRGSTYRRPSPQ